MSPGDPIPGPALRGDSIGRSRRAIMSKAWRDHDDWQDDEPEEPRWSEELSFGDPDAWRGGVYDTAQDTWQRNDTEWPEWDAGPEYQMWKRLADDDEP